MLKLIQRWWNHQDPSVRELRQYLGKALNNFYHAGTGRAAALAYYTIFSVFPLSLLLTILVSKMLGPVAAQEQIASALGLFLPPETVQLLKENINEAMQQSTSFTLIALAGLIWSALGLFSNVTHSLDTIFMVPARRSLWRQRLVALAMTIILVVLVAASFITSAALRLVSASLLGQSSVWLSIAIVFLPLGLNMVIFMLLFRYVPSRFVHWDAVWPAAIFGAAGWELIKIGFVWYTSSIANFQFIYGGIATAIVLLFWAYLLAAVFLLSAEFCAQLNQWYLAQHNAP
jgi:membrane protein